MGPYVQIGRSLVVRYALLNLTVSAVLADNAALGRQWRLVLLVCLGADRGHRARTTPR